MEIDAESSSDPPLVLAFVEMWIAEADTEGHQRLIHLTTCDRSDRGRIEPPADVRRNRDVGSQTKAGRVIQQLPQLFDEVDVGPRLCGLGEIEVPPACLPAGAVPADEQVVG